MHYASGQWLGRRSNAAVPAQPQPTMQARRIGTIFGGGYAVQATICVILQGHPCTVIPILGKDAP